MLGFKKVIASTIVALLVSPLAGQAATIYSDSFNRPGSGTALLGGSTPDVRPASETWTASTSTGAFVTNGTVATSTTGNLTAYLPFNPSSSTIYSLTSLVNPQFAGDQTHWIAIGFFTSSTPTTAFNFAGARAYTLVRGNGEVVTNPDGTNQTFSANGYAGEGTFGFSAANPLSIRVDLNTQPTNWTAAFYVNNTVVRTHTYTVNPTNITAIGLGNFGDGRGNFNSFALSVPEPAMAGVFGLLMTLGMRRRQEARAH